VKQVTALSDRGEQYNGHFMVAPIPVVLVDKPISRTGRAVFLFLHTIAVYVCVLFFSPQVVSFWFRWLAPRLQINSNITYYAWLWHHVLLVSVAPALIVGYLTVRRLNSMATWAWAVPALVLAYKMLTYHASGSVLYENRVSLFQYFFGVIQADDPFVVDPWRLLMQWDVTAPFYAGVAYSAGALLSKHGVFKSLFTFHHVKEPSN